MIIRDKKIDSIQNPAKDLNPAIHPSNDPTKDHANNSIDSGILINSKKETKMKRFQALTHNHAPIMALAESYPNSEKLLSFNRIQDIMFPYDDDFGHRQDDMNWFHRDKDSVDDSQTAPINKDDTEESDQHCIFNSASICHGCGDCENSEKNPCYDCGSTIPKHHTKTCDMTRNGNIKDLPSKPGTQYWTGINPDLDPTPLPAFERINRSIFYLTEYRGDITADYNHLIKTFGEPTPSVDCSKVKAELEKEGS